MKDFDIVINTGNTKGLTRKLDELGRVVLPMEFRKELNLNPKAPVEIYLLPNGFYVAKK